MEQEIIDNKYELIEEIGKGGQGTIFLANHIRLKRKVVLKRIPGFTCHQELDRLEVDILKNLRHKNLPKVYDFVRQNDYVYSVIEYIPGKSLDQLADEGYRFKQKEVLRWMMDLCETLVYLHNQKPAVLHCDIKPQNIMLSDTGMIYLIDFNIASYVSQDASFYGYTEKYASPEQRELFLRQKRGRGISEERIENVTVTKGCGSVSDLVADKVNVCSLDGRTDIYSLGGTIYYLLTGRYPNSGERGPAQRYGVHRKFARVINKAIAVDRDKRYQSAEEMFFALEKVRKPKRRYLLYPVFLFILIILSLCMQKPVEEEVAVSRERLADEDFANYEYKKALQAYKEIAENADNVAYYNIRIADCYDKMGELDGALDYLRGLYRQDQAKIYRDKIVEYLIRKLERSDDTEERISIEEEQIALGEVSETLYQDILKYYTSKADYETVQKYVSMAQKDNLGHYVDRYAEMLSLIDKNQSIIYDLYKACENYDLNGLMDLCMNDDYFKMTRIISQPFFYKSHDAERDFAMGIYNNGYIYYGEVEEGIRQGRGVWFDISSANAIIFEGDWERDMPNGEGSFMQLSAEYGFRTYHSNVIDGVLDGECTVEEYVYTFIYSGGTTNGIPNGQYVFEDEYTYTYINKMGVTQAIEMPSELYGVVPDNYTLVHYDPAKGRVDALPQKELKCVGGLGLEGM